MGFGSLRAKEIINAADSTCAAKAINPTSYRNNADNPVSAPAANRRQISAGCVNAFASINVLPMASNNVGYIGTSDGCSADYSETITVTSIGINETNDESVVINSKNNLLTIKFDHPAKDATIKVVDALGQILINETFNKGTTFNRTLNIASSYVIVSVHEGEKVLTKKVLITQ